jgi:hypothetical protein
VVVFTSKLLSLAVSVEAEVKHVELESGYPANRPTINAEISPLYHIPRRSL